MTYDEFLQKQKIDKTVEIPDRPEGGEWTPLLKKRYCESMLTLRQIEKALKGLIIGKHEGWTERAKAEAAEIRVFVAFMEKSPWQGDRCLMQGCGGEIPVPERKGSTILCVRCVRDIASGGAHRKGFQAVSGGFEMKVRKVA